MTLTEFLLARIAEDEKTSRRYLDLLPDGNMAPLLRRVAAECEAKRRIIALAQYVEENEGGGAAIALFDGYNLGLSGVLPVLASMYADHPDYQPKWRP